MPRGISKIVLELLLFQVFEVSERDYFVLMCDSHFHHQAVYHCMITDLRIKSVTLSEQLTGLCLLE